MIDAWGEAKRAQIAGNASPNWKCEPA